MQSSQGAGRQRFWFLLVTTLNLLCGHCIHCLQVVLRFHTVVLPHMQPVPAYNEPSDTIAQYVKSNLYMCHRSKIMWHKQLFQAQICGPLLPQGSSVFSCSYFWHLSTKKVSAGNVDWGLTWQPLFHLSGSGSQLFYFFFFFTWEYSAQKNVGLWMTVDWQTENSNCLPSSALIFTSQL